MLTGMITKQHYVECLIRTPINYTCFNLSEHLYNVSHDGVSNFLKRGRITARHLWERVKGLIINNKEDAFLIIDDNAQDKRYSKSIELVKKRYSGVEVGLVRGIGVVSLVHSDGQEHYPLDHWIYDNAVNGKTKNDHFKGMLVNAIADKGSVLLVLFDSWYASWENMKWVHSLKRTFYTTLKSNRLVSLSKEAGYVHLDAIKWRPQRLQSGGVVKLKKARFKVKLFKLVAPNGNIDWFITNELNDNLTARRVAQDPNDVRWQVEEFHRELKQLTGSEKCQCRKARSQRNHISYTATTSGFP